MSSTGYAICEPRALDIESLKIEIRISRGKKPKEARREEIEEG